MLNTAQIDGLAQRLSEGDTKALPELLDHADAFVALNEYPHYLQKTYMMYLQLLGKVQPSFTLTLDHKLRNTVLELIHRCVPNEAFFRYVEPTMASMNDVLQKDNEENGVLAMKIVVNIHKSYKNGVFQHVQGFLSLFSELYPRMCDLLACEQDSQDSMLPALSSYKTLAEFPLIFVSLLLVHKQLISSALPAFLPLLLDFLRAEVPCQKQSRDSGHVGPSPQIKNRALYDDAIVAQTKALSFLAYVILRGHCASQLWERSSEVPEIVVRLLKDFPKELASARKELLLAIKHVLSTPYSRLFLPHVHVLMDMRVLLGDSVTARALLKGVAYNMAADFLHVVRAELAPEHVTKAVYMYAHVLKYSNEGAAVQAMSLKLLSNMLERVVKMDRGRDLVFVILDAHCAMFSRLRDSPIEPALTNTPEDPIDEPLSLPGEKPSNLVSPEHVTEPASYPNQLEAEFPIQLVETPTVACRPLFRTALNFMKLAFFVLRQTNPAAPTVEMQSTWGMQARAFTHSEVHILSTILRQTVRCLRFFRTASTTPSKEEHELMETIGAMYARLEPRVLHGIFSKEIEFLMAETKDHPALLQLLHFFLGAETTLAVFLGVLLPHLKQNFHELGGNKNEKETPVMVRVFKLALFLLKLHPQNAHVMASHVLELVEQCVEAAQKSEQPAAYYSLLRTLFKTISNGKIDVLYEAVTLLLPGLLDDFDRLLSGSLPLEQQECAKLVLSAPLGLTQLATNAPHLVRPISVALDGPSDLASDGLRMLEKCIDHMSPHFFETLFEPVFEQVVSLLGNLLSELSPLAHHAARVLGKLGGLSRKHVTPSRDLEPRSSGIPSAPITVQVAGCVKEQTFDAAVGMRAALDALELSTIEVHYKKNALEYVTALLEVEAEPLFEHIVDALFMACTEELLRADAVAQLTRICDNHLENQVRGLLGCLSRAALSLSREVRVEAQHVTERLVQKGLKDDLFKEFIHKCYSEVLVEKSGAVLCLQTLCNSAGVQQHTDIVRALLFVLKDQPARGSTWGSEAAEALLDHVVSTCEHPAPENIVTLLVADLASAQQRVRSCAQRSLRTLAERENNSGGVGALLAPSKQLLVPIFGKPLRALALHVQIAHIEAVRFWLLAGQTSDEGLARMVDEALGMLQADDQMLVGTKMWDKRTKELLIELRMACVALLSAFLEVEDSNSGLRLKVLAALFKALCSSDFEIIDCAYEALSKALSQNAKLPKQLLQDGLRPMLMNLADYKLLTAGNLRALARLLVLLTSYFKVEIGKKLMDHLRCWASPATLAKLSSSSLDLELQNEVKVMCAILHIFHLLPPKAVMFMLDVMGVLAHLEQHLRVSFGLPFRKEVAHYVERFSKEAYTFFKDNFGVSQPCFAFFVEKCPSFAKVVEEHLDELLSKVNNPELYCNFVSILDKLPGDVNESVLTKVVDLSWQIVGPEPLPAVQQAFLDLQVLVVLHFHAQGNVEGLATFLGAFAANLHELALPALHELMQLYIKSDNLEALQKVLATCVEVLLNKPDEGVFLFNLLALPLLCWEKIQSGKLHKLAEAPWFETLHEKVWKNLTLDPPDYAKIAWLQLTLLLTSSATLVTEPARKDVIKFSWLLSRLEDALTKAASFLVICHFIRVFASPAKIRTNMLVTLLRDTAPETRHVVREALALLAPSMEPEGTWFRLPRRVILEQGVLLGVFRFVVSQKELFYGARKEYIASCVTTLGRLSMMQAADQQTLAVELGETLAWWETEEHKQGGSRDSVTFGQREAVVTFLVRFACICKVPGLAGRARSVLDTLLSYWGDVSVKLSFFVQFLESDAHCVGALYVLAVCLSHRDPSWVVESLPELHTTLERAIRSDNVAVQDALQGALDTILTAIKADTSADDEFEPESVKNFMALLVGAIQDGLQNPSSVALGVLLCWNVGKVLPERLNQLFPALMRTFGRLCKDHVMADQHQGAHQGAPSTQNNQTQNNNAAPATQNAPLIADSALSKRLLVRVMRFGAERILYLGDQRRVYLSLVAQLIEKADNDVLAHVLHIVRTFVFAKAVFPTSKEKAAILCKMGSVLSGKKAIPFLDIVLSIFENDAYAHLDLTQRLELPFLVGSTSTDVATRKRFLGLMEDSLPPNIGDRLMWFIGGQSWDAIADFPWLAHGCILLGACVRAPLIAPLLEVTWGSLRRHINAVWCALFPIAHAAVPRLEFARAFALLLVKEHVLAQAGTRHNVVQGLLAAATGVHVPPPLLQHCALCFGAHYEAARILEQLVASDNAAVSSAAHNALCGANARLGEADVFYGLWRTVAGLQTCTALEREQAGLLRSAQVHYERAQAEARGGAPHSEAEYALWEDGWTACAARLQQWEVLGDLARHENDTDMLLESGWRSANWAEEHAAFEAQATAAMAQPTARRTLFGAFAVLQGFCAQQRSAQEVARALELHAQMVCAKWAQVPARAGGARGALMCAMQQHVELAEAAAACGALSAANAQNADAAAAAAQRALATWRLRLPNAWEDVAAWGDLTAQRLHVYTLLNQLPRPFSAGKSEPEYRGFHETAFMINRFARAARKQGLAEVCVAQLAKIYLLPNIEILEAFVKLTEQAKCHYMGTAELNSGLDVIVNTNLSYFANSQKAEFLALKGNFQTKLGALEEANQLYTAAVGLDRGLAAAWSLWGFFSYKLYCSAVQRAQARAGAAAKYARNAITCLLSAAGLYKSFKSRRCLAVVLWLLSLDDERGSLVEAATNFKGELSVWYWISFVAQLVGGLSGKEASFVGKVLMAVGRKYPQAVHFALRGEGSALNSQSGQNSQNNQNSANLVLQQDQNNQSSSTNQASQTTQATHNNQNADQNGQNTGQNSQNTGQNGQNNGQNNQASANSNVSSADTSTNLTSENQAANSSGTSSTPPTLESIRLATKTQYPLLALSLELLGDQITQRFKTTAHEDAYKLVMALLNDATVSYSLMQSPAPNMQLPQQLKTNIARLANSILPRDMREEFENDLLKSEPSFLDYIAKLGAWRTRLAETLDSRPPVLLEKLSPHLAEFHLQAVEPLEVPGQYLAVRDPGARFARIERFLAARQVRGAALCARRLSLRAHNGHVHVFTVQCPSHRHSRREEKAQQLGRLWGDVLSRAAATRLRHVTFTLPEAVALLSHVRIVAEVEASVLLYEVYEQYCKHKQQGVEEPFFYAAKKKGSDKTEVLALIQALYCPENVVRDYFESTYAKYEDWWVFRKQFASQYASFAFMCHALSITGRHPHKIHIGLHLGRVWTLEMIMFRDLTSNSEVFAGSLLPQEHQRVPVVHCNEAVPIRLTPGIVCMMGSVAMEGIFVVHMFLAGRALLLEALEDVVNVFVRDEISSYAAQRGHMFQGAILREVVAVSVRGVAARVRAVGNELHEKGVFGGAREVHDRATNKTAVAKMDALWRAYL